VLRDSVEATADAVGENAGLARVIKCGEFLWCQQHPMHCTKFPLETVWVDPHLTGRTTCCSLTICP